MKNRNDFMWTVVGSGGRELVHPDTNVWGPSGAHFTWGQIKALEIVDEWSEDPEICPENFYDNDFVAQEDGEIQSDIGWGNEEGTTFAMAYPVVD